ncbi:Ig-like domain-containing protein [Pantoea sp. GbtcB22]|uniref:Ig-like domain-containing protein n=1 Tax=Pantoea sp. GbtcB22 TaxID=2824767 RepID=UPI001C30F7D5|nr:Ig-like domain-containing protein [Pantoea sp. GbtcB22]
MSNNRSLFNALRRIDPRRGLALSNPIFINLTVSIFCQSRLTYLWNILVKTTSQNSTACPTWARHMIYLQIAVQAGMALTPFYAVTVNAASKQPAEEHMLSGTAQHASVFGQAVQSGSLNGYAVQQTTGMASQELQQWLNNFGTARVEFGTDSHFRPRAGAVDLLLPLYKTPERLLFTQNGVRNVDGQITGNFGLGQRHFIGDWMIGYNAFYDQNFSRDHKRLGSGVEAWRDYLKLSGNGYYRLSDWRNSGDVEDYDARPANGFDLRAEAWLPAYAAIGGRLMYEKYYGNEVALYGKDKRQKNPDAITAGLSYTPVPLLSFTADHKRGGSQNDTRFGLQLTYQLGQSLASHFDTSAVNMKRTLAGSGMDLVERNNNIVLEYRKQQLIDLVLPKEISGQSGKTVPVNYQLTSKYALAKIVWNDASIVAAGGKMQDLSGGKYQLMLPKYSAGAINSWPLSGVAYDARNNASKVAATMVTVTRPQVSAEKSVVAASPETILADGTTTSIVSFTLNDETGTPVTGMAADIAVTLKEEQANTPLLKAKAKSKAVTAKSASISDVTEQANGVYTVTLTSGTRPMLAVLTATLGEIALHSVAVNQISDAASAQVKEGDLKLIADNAVANASAINSAQARVTDATGNPVAGVAVTFALSGSAQVAPGSSLAAVSDQNGYVTVQFISKVAETVSVTANTANNGSAKVNATFIADKNTATLAENDLTVDRISAVADGSDKVTFIAVIKDANGNLVSDVRVDWSANGGSLSGSSSVSGTDGKATITLSSTAAQMVQTSATPEGRASVSAPVVSFGADAASGGIGQNDLTVNKASATANGTDGIIYTAMVKDANGNPLAGQTVNWLTSVGNLNAASSITDANGQATIILTSLQAAAAQVTASLTGKPAVNAPQVSFIADAASAQIGSGDLTVDKSSIVGNNADAATFTAIVKDANGNPLAGQNVSWSTDRGSLNAASSTTNASGAATIRLTGTTAGIAQVKAQVNGNAAVNAPQVTVTADSSSAQIGSGDLTADKTTALANGTEAVTYTAQVRDASGNPVSGITVSWGKNLGNLSAPTSNTGADGKATITLTSPTAGSATVTATPGSGSTASASAVSFTADGSTAVISSGDLSVDKTTVVANNIDMATYTALVKDANGNLVANHSVSWSTTKGTLSSASALTGPDGKATIELRHTVAELATVTATVNAVATNANPVTFVADAATARVAAIDSVKEQIVGNNEDSTELRVTIRDAHGNPINSTSVTWGAVNGMLSGSNSMTDDNGIANITLQPVLLNAPAAQTAVITATINGTSLNKNIAIMNVYSLNGRMYWTQNSFALTNVESTAIAACSLRGGTVANRTDIESFLSNGGDFKRFSGSSSPTVEFSNIRYSLGGEWNYSADLSGVNTGPTGPRMEPGVSYVCIK